MAYFIPEHAVCGLHFYMLIYTPYYFFIIPFLVRTPPPMSVIPLRSDKISALRCRPQPPLQYYTIREVKKKQFPSMHVLNNFADNTICALSPRGKSCRRMCARFVIKKQLVRLFLISSTKYCSPAQIMRVLTLQKISAAGGIRYKKVIGAENHNAPPPHRCCAEEATILSHLLKITLRKLLPLCGDERACSRHFETSAAAPLMRFQSPPK